MPTYLYECNTCEKQFEVEQRITEAPLTDCDCGKGQVRRLIQPTAILFKGAGFHINDYSASKASTSADSATPGGADCSGNPASCAKCDTDGA